MKEKIKSILIFSVLFFIFDQIIKIFLNSRMVINESFLLIKNFLSITLIHNTGAAFSIFTDSGYFLVIIGILSLIGIVLYIKNLDVIEDIDILIYSLLIGGILGNLIDRVIHGYVIDYISFKFGSYYFPIFNLADICIVISIVLILARTIKEDLWS